MPLTVATLYSGRGNTSNTATYVSTPFQPQAGNLLLAWVANSKASAPNTPVISDSRFTWTLITSKNAGSLNILHVFRAMAGTQGTSPASGGATVGFSASQTGCAFGFLEIAGVPNSNDGSSAIVQYGSSTTGTGVTTSTTTLSALAKPSNAVFSGLCIGVNANPTKETAYTAAATHPGYNSPTSRLGMSWLLSADTEVTPSWSWVGARAPGEIALEIVSYGTNRSITTSLGTLGLHGPSDTFDTDANPLASPWGAVGYTAGGLRALSGACIKTSPTSETDNAMHYTGAGSKSEQYSKFEYTSGSDIGLLCRSTATQCYQMNLVGGSIAAFHEWTSAGGWSFNVVSNIPSFTLSGGDEVMFAVTGTTGAATFAMYLNGSNIGTRVYTTGAVLVNGYPGIQMYSGDSPSVDNWAGGPITGSKGLNWWSQLAAAAAGAVNRTLSVLRAATPSVKRLGEYIRKPVAIRPVVEAAKRLATYKKTVSIARSLLSRASRVVVYVRTLSVTRAIRSIVGRVVSLWVRRVSMSASRMSVVSRLRWLKRAAATVRSVSLLAKRLAIYKKTIAVSRSLLSRVGRVAVFARTILVVRSLGSIVSRTITLYVRRISVQRPTSFVVKRIGQYARRISTAIGWALAVGRSISGTLTVRTVATMRVVSLSVRRIANYKKTIIVSRAISDSVRRLATRVRRISSIRPISFTVKRLRELIRRSTNTRSLLSAVRRRAWYKRPISLSRPVATSVKRISQIGRRISTATRATFGLVWHIAGALTTRTIATVGRVSDVVSRRAWKIRVAMLSRATSTRVSYSRWLKRVALRYGVSAFAVARSAEYIRKVVTTMRNNFAVAYIVTAVLRIWNAISSSYRNIVALTSSRTRLTVNSDSKKQTETKSSSAKLSEFTTSSRQKERVS